MSVGPIRVSPNSFFERVFACPVAHGSEGGRAAQSSTEGWAWQVLGRARQSRAAPARAGQRMAEAGRVSAGHCRVERREQGKGWGRAAQRTEQSRGWAGQSSDWAELGLGRASLWFAEWQSRAVQGQRRGLAGQGNAEGKARAGHGSAQGRAEQGLGRAEQGLGRAGAWQDSTGAWRGRAVTGQSWGLAGRLCGSQNGSAGQGRATQRAGHGSAEGRAEQGLAGESRGWAEQGLRRGSTGPGQGRAGPSQGRAVQRSEGFSSRFDRLEVPSGGSNGHFEHPGAPSGGSSSLFECLGVPSGSSNNHFERPGDTERGLEYPF